MDKTVYSKFQRQFYRELDHKKERCDDDHTVAKVTKVGVVSEDVGMEFGIKSALSWYWRKERL